MGENNHDHDEDVDVTDTDTDNHDEDATEDDADTSQNTDADDGADDDADDADEADDADDDASKDGKDDDGKGNSDKSTDTAKDDDTKDEDDGEEPELRKPKAGATNAEWAAYRKQQKAKAAAAKKSDDDADDKDTDEDDDDLSSEDAAAIDKRIAKRLAPFEQKAAEQEVEATIASFLNENPDFKPFATKVKRFAMHPSRQNIPIKSIFYEVAGDKLLKIGADRAKQADIKAKKTKTGGGNASTDGKGSKSYADMPLEDFGKELDAVKSRR